MCPNKSVKGSSYCTEHKCIADKAADTKRLSSRERGYDSKWDKASKTFVKNHPICMICGIRPSAVTDHIVPHKGDMKLFWNKSNWQAACEHCHNAKTAGEGAFGRPIK
jgi:5-methylcytosine-specific restriction protein A